ncbi:MAG: hypothetical protein JW938_01485 [Candidatus Omnitrophica bacterium]|nr:hypothetical protein [Candidatus Omnitrophota bacterium]
MMRWVRRSLTFIGITILLVIIMLIIIEGIAGVMIAGSHFIHSPMRTVRERIHTEFDPLLGWRHIPGIHKPNCFRRGVGITVNQQGLRATQEYSRSIPPGKFRVVCVGDSYTMGFGVNDHETWPVELEKLDTKIEAINMGMSGYGLDQMYLWYMRDNEKFEHAMAIIAISCYDIERMLSGTFLGYPKPVLGIDNDNTVCVAKAPRKPLFFLSPDIPILIVESLRSLHVVKMAEFIARKRIARLRSEFDPTNVAVTAVIDAIVADIGALALSHDREVVFAYLPSGVDFVGKRISHQVKAVMSNAVRKAGLQWLDISPAFDRFLKEHAFEDITLEDGHYTALGQRCVAEAIHEAIKERSML